MLMNAQLMRWLRELAAPKDEDGARFLLRAAQSSFALPPGWKMDYAGTQALHSAWNVYARHFGLVYSLIQCYAAINAQPPWKGSGHDKRENSLETILLKPIMYPAYALHRELEQRLSEKNFRDLNDTLSFIREYMHNRLLFSKSPELQAFMRSFDAAPTGSTEGQCYCRWPPTNPVLRSTNL